jgi:large conductance mechanosensitive channel
MNTMKRRQEAAEAAPEAPAEPSEEVKLLTEIRDALKK